MEAAASVVAAAAAAARGVSLPMSSSQPLRKEWRAVSEHSVRNVGNEDLERSNLGQADERTIYEVQQGREAAEVDFCSITIDGGLDNNIVQQRLHSIVRQREELQHMEIELRAQLIGRTAIMEMQSSFDAQIKEHANANVKLQEQLREREQAIHELERKMEDKERELHTIKLDNEAAWAKEDILREQNKELASFRRERDSSEAERAQHLKQIHDLQEHIQEKDRQFMELQDQHRVAQENILFKDEQLREAEAWIRRVQEMDALQSTTLQAELRERTEQYTQLWHLWQRQFVDMERVHLHTVQQLQIQLADVRERSGTYPDESRESQANSKDISQFGQNNGSQLDVNGSGTPSGNSGVHQNGNAENVPSYPSIGNASTLTEHVPGAPIAPSSLLGMPSYLPPGQVTALHPLVLHQQGVPHSVPSHVNQSHIGHFHSAPGVSSLQHWQSQQVASEGSEMPNHNQYLHSQIEQNMLGSDANYDYEVPINGQALHPDHLDVHGIQGTKPDSVIPSSAEGGQVLEPMDKSYPTGSQPQQSLQQISSQFHDALRLEPLPQNSETKEGSFVTLPNHGLESHGLTMEQASSPANALSSETAVGSVNFIETKMNNLSGSVLPEVFVSSGQKNTHSVGKILETTLLDERSLLAFIVRTIPPGPGGRIRISSTLPNRLGKMLAPLHWHDYKKKYGKLDDFVAGHPELFVIEGDFIQLREGAQGIIAATVAVAKVPPASAASSPYSSLLPSVAVTPMAQSSRLKRAPSIDSNSVKTERNVFKDYGGPTAPNSTDNTSQSLAMQNPHSNGVPFNISGDFSNVKILSKPKDSLELNGPETRPGQSSGPMTVGNGASQDRPGLSNSQSKSSTQGRPGASIGGKPQGRMTLLASASRR